MGAPLLAVLAAFAGGLALVWPLALAGAEDATPGVVLGFVVSLLLLVLGAVIVRGHPDHERRLGLAAKGSRIAGAGLALLVAAGAIMVSGLLLVLGMALDPGLEQRLEDLSPQIDGPPWKLTLAVAALLVLAPLGEELLFRALLVRALVRRLPFWSAAGLSGAAWAASHLDAYPLWPRLPAITLTGMAFAWLYRRHGYWAAVLAHALVNGAAAAATLA